MLAWNPFGIAVQVREDFVNRSVAHFNMLFVVILVRLPILKPGNAVGHSLGNASACVVQIYRHLKFSQFENDSQEISQFEVDIRIAARDDTQCGQTCCLPLSHKSLLCLIVQLSSKVARRVHATSK